MISFKGLMKCSCIYGFYLNDVCEYVGSCENFFKRMGKQIENISRKHRNIPLANFLEENQENIEVRILQKVNFTTNDKLRMVEQEWMDKLKPRFNVIRAHTSPEMHLARARDRTIRSNPSRDLATMAAYAREKVDCPTCDKNFNRGSLLKHRMKCNKKVLKWEQFTQKLIRRDKRPWKYVKNT